jgi:UDP-N-acetylmuramate dehydrogenase
LPDIQQNISLTPMTTLGVGGPAKYFVRAESETDIAEAFSFSQIKKLDVFILGGGSNILVADAGFDGLVIQVSLNGVEVAGPTEGGRRIVTAAAGENWDLFVAYCVEQNLAGIECLSGIPGSVGGTPVQNVGAYGQDVSESIISVRCFDRERGEIVTLSRDECGFEYRSSIFNTSHRDTFIVLNVMYGLREGGRPKIVYKDLIGHFSGKTPDLSETRRAVLDIRRSKSMVIEPGDPNSQSVGSFFKNPVVGREKFDKIAAASLGVVPSFPSDHGKVKIPAAWLIENACFHKGFRMGNAGISTKHTLAIVNCGGATASDILSLKNAVQTAVLERFGIELQPEPVFVGHPLQNS